MTDEIAELEFKLGELNKNFHRLMDLNHMEHRQFSEFDRGLREMAELLKRLKHKGDNQ